MNRIIYAASERNADMLYATRFSAPDAFLYFEKAGRRYIVLNQLEYDRGRKEARVDEVINLGELLDQLQKGKSGRVTAEEWIAELLRRHRLSEVCVSPSFSVALADALRKKRFRLRVVRGDLFPERAVKGRDELVAIRKSLRVTSELLQAAIETIRSSRIGRGGILMSKGVPLTSERVQAVIRMEAARRGFEARHPIVAGGGQACDPHETGHGRLRANELIIIDIFPRDLKTGYWGDMTRTVLRGRATEAQRRQFETVRQAQKLAISKLRHGVDGQKVHRAVDAWFRQKGYQTGNASGRYEGFFHGTGHGLGLEIHESPRLSSWPQKLVAGNVVTVEPGLYYLGVGGVRIEDVVVMRRGGCDLLSHFPVQLEI